MDGHKFSWPAYIKARLLSCFALYDWLLEKASNKFTRRFCTPCASGWLGFLIHIHSNHRVLHISNCFLMGEDVLFGCGPILLLKEEDA